MAKVADIHVGIGAKTDELDRGLDKAKGSLKSFANSAKMALGAVGLGMGLREIGQVALEASKLAGKVEDVENAFNRLNRPDLLDKMKQATQGTVDNLNLMQQAIMADNFRIPLDVMAKGLEFATIRAKETGQEVDYLVNSFVTGMGRKSIMILDNLGLSMREIQEETKKTGDFATAVGVIMDRELAKAGKQGVSTSVAYAQLNAEMQNLKANAGAIINVLFKVNEELQKQTGSISQLNMYLDFWQDMSGTVAKKIAGDFVNILMAEKDVEKQHKMLTDEMEKYKSKVLDLRDANIAGNREAENQTLIYTKVWSLLNDINLEYDDYAINLDKATEAAAALRKEQQMLNDALDAQSSMWQKAFGNIEIAGPDRKNMIDWGMIDPLITEEALDPEPYIKFTEDMKKRGESFAQSMDFFNQQVTNSFIGMAEGVGSAIGEMIATGEVGFRQFLQIAVEFAKQFGAIMIALGVAKNALLPGSGVNDIIAGVALGTVASGVGSYLSHSQSHSSMSARGLNVNVTGSTKISGNDLAVVYGRGNSNRNGLT